MTSDLPVRIQQHRTGQTKGFTARYGVSRLVWYEVLDSMEGAFRREKQMKKWCRSWKVELIEASKPGWRDLFDDLF